MALPSCPLVLSSKPSLRTCYHLLTGGVARKSSDCALVAGGYGQVRAGHRRYRVRKLLLVGVSMGGRIIIVRNGYAARTRLKGIDSTVFKTRGFSASYV